MRGPWRAAMALALHVGSFAVPCAIVLGLAGIAVVTFEHSRGSGLRAGLAALVVGTVFAVGLWAVLRPRIRFRGVPVEPSEQPRLWRTVQSIAAAADVPEPDEIRITSEPSSGLKQDTALLGLRTRACCLEIGLPLLAALDVSELRAVAVRELVQPSVGGKLNTVVDRISASIEATYAALPDGVIKWFFAGYARCYAAVAGTSNSMIAADVAVAKLVGKRLAVATHRKITAIEYGWRQYAEEYLRMAASVERTPDVLLGFRSFMDHPVRKPELAERAKQAIAEEDGDHPTLRKRIEVLRRVNAREPEIDDRPAFTLLRNPRKSVPELEDRLLVDGLGPRVPWPELAQLAGAARAVEQAAQLSSAVKQSGIGGDASIGAVLAAIHRGSGPDLINPALNPGLQPDHVPEAAVDTLTELLGGTVVDALICAGRARHELDWGGPCTVRLANGRLLDPDQLVRPAICDPRLVPGLHRALVGLGVPLQHRRPPAAEPEPSVAGIVSPVRYGPDRYELLVTDRGLLLVPSRVGTTQRLLAEAIPRVRKAEDDHLAALSSATISELRDRHGTQWLDSRDIAGARMVQDRSGWTLWLELYLDEYAVSRLDMMETDIRDDGMTMVELRSTADSVERDDPYGALGDLMGARMDIEDHRE